jgi:hypothetical protein
MFGKSRLLVGLLSENAEAVTSQTTLWDRSNVWQATWDQAAKTKVVKRASSFLTERVGDTAKQIGNKISESLPDWVTNQSAPEEHPLDPFVRKLCRLADHARVKLDEPLAPALLHDICLRIERDGVNTLKSADNRTILKRIQERIPMLGAPPKKFEGESIDDLVRYVISRTFEQLDQTYHTKTPEEQEQIAVQIADALSKLPEEEQERIVKATGLTDLTKETLVATGSIASVGVGLSALVGVAGFASYTTLTSVVAAVTGLVGIHLSFGTYVYLTSYLALGTNPVFFMTALAGGGFFLTKNANHSVRSLLYPTLIATSVMSYVGSEGSEPDLHPLISRIDELKAKISVSDGADAARLVSRFPGLGQPSRLARLMSNVVS